MKLGLAFLPMWPINRAPLGIACVASYLREKGHDVSIFDENVRVAHQFSKTDLTKDLWNWSSWAEWDNAVLFKDDVEPIIQSWLEETFQRLLSEARENDLQALGFSVYSTNRIVTLDICKRLKIAHPSLKLFIGGPEVTNDTCTSSLRTGDVDALVFGEGEVSAAELIQSWQYGERKPSIPNVLQSFESASRPLRSRPQMHPDHIPPVSFRGFDFDSYEEGSLPLMTSRGCIAACVFCSEAPLWGKYRYRSSERIIQEIEAVTKETGSNEIYFSDSLLNGNHQLLMEWTQKVIDKKIDITFEGNARLDPRLTLDALQIISRSGCRQLTYGLETGSQKIMNKMRKGVRKEKAEEVIRNTHLAGITVSLNIIVGFPGETEEDFQETLNFIFRNRESIGFISTGFGLDLGPHMPMMSALEKYDIRLNEDGSPYVDKFGKWCSVDGQNNYRMRVKRAARLWQLLDELEIPYHPKNVKNVSNGVTIIAGSESVSLKIPVWSQNERGAE